MTIRILPALSLLAAVACGTEAPPTGTMPQAAPSQPPAAKQPAARPATATLRPDQLAGSLQAVRARVRELNALRHWDKVAKRDLYNSTEGGEAAYYYQNGRPAKIVARNFGETFQHLAEYYLQPDGQLAFVLEKATRYNRPYYYDSAAAQAGGDTEAFDLKKSTIAETRSYFHQGQLVRQLSGAQEAAQTRLPAEQKRLRADLTDLLHALNAPN